MQVNILAAAFNNNAFPNLTADPDDFIRKQELIEEPDAQGSVRRGLAFRVAEKFRGADAEFEKGRLMWGGRAIPWNHRGPDHHHQLRRAARNVSVHLALGFYRRGPGREEGPDPASG